MSNRRSFLQQALALGAGGLALGRRAAAAPPPLPFPAPGAPGPVAVQTPDLAKLPWTLDHGVKVFRLRAEPVRQELIPGKTLDLWGFNGSSPGPLIEANQGDRVRIVFDNHLPEPISIHWHGLEVPNAMDGVTSITQPPVLPGGRFVYEFTLHQEGTYFYHSHMAMQEMLGLIGPLVLQPRQPYSTQVDKDFLIVMQEFAALPNNPVPNTMSMEFNWLTFNGKSGPATTPLIVRHNEKVKIRLINMGMDHHPIHLHGFQFWITGTEGGRQPESNWIRRNTVLVGVAQAYDVEFDAVHLGEWMLHCHLPHHMMNQMASTVGPMTRTPGMPAAGSMESGMGMVQEGAAALSDQFGASLGRGMGLPGREHPVTNGPQGGQATSPSMPGMQMPDSIAAHANQVPGFPQDAYMEGPAMAMDAAVAKPETYGLQPGWSGSIQGMMTIVRVLRPEIYDKIQQLRAQAGKADQQ
ncbi:MAG TPA: copper oxidase [Terriglobales bacterium]|nr:copper oxidase [Terriglobales bacterium]